MNKEENIKYWKKRMIDKIRSMVGQMELDFKGIDDNAKHINLGTKKILRQMRLCIESLDNLAIMIDKGKEVKNGPTNKPKA